MEARCVSSTSFQLGGAQVWSVRRGASCASDNTYYVYYVTGTKEGPRLREVCLGPREEIVESRLLITGRDGPRLRCYVHRLHHRSGGLHRRWAGLRLRRWAGLRLRRWAGRHH